MLIITGGAGFIGSCLIAELNKLEINDILVVDNLGLGDKWKNLANKKFTQFIHKDKFRQMILENDHLSFGSNVKAIIHLGACSSTVEKNADYLMDNNFLYSKELAMFSIRHNIRFIYASSAATYGTGNFGYSDSTINNLAPLNIYGLSKHLFDMWIVQNKLENSVTGIKFFNVFGPNEYHKAEMRSMLMKSFEQIKSTKKVKLFKSENENFKDGEQKRDFIYVKDCTKIILQMLGNKEFTGIYNLGTGKARSWNELANAVFSAMNLKPNIEYIDLPENLSKQYQYFTEADTVKLMNKLDEKFEFTSLENAASDYIINYLEPNNYL